MTVAGQVCGFPQGQGQAAASRKRGPVPPGASLWCRSPAPCRSPPAPAPPTGRDASGRRRAVDAIDRRPGPRQVNLADVPVLTLAIPARGPLPASLQLISRSTDLRGKWVEVPSPTKCRTCAVHDRELTDCCQICVVDIPYRVTVREGAVIMMTSLDTSTSVSSLLDAVHQIEPVHPRARRGGRTRTSPARRHRKSHAGMRPLPPLAPKGL